MYMEIEPSENEKIRLKNQKEQEEREKSFSSEFSKDAAVDVAIDEATGLANITMPLEELQLLLKVFKMIDKSINKDKGLMR